MDTYIFILLLTKTLNADEVSWAERPLTLKQPSTNHILRAIVHNFNPGWPNLGVNRTIFWIFTFFSCSCSYKSPNRSSGSVSSQFTHLNLIMACLLLFERDLTSKLQPLMLQVRKPVSVNTLASWNPTLTSQLSYSTVFTHYFKNQCQNGQTSTFVLTQMVFRTSPMPICSTFFILKR